jgi:di/tricarboxylate transporter
MPGEISDVAPARDKMPISIAILCGMVLVTRLDLMPLVAAVLLAVIAAIATRCLTMEQAYRLIHWSSIVLIAGMLPLADALTATGGTELVVNKLFDFAGDSGPYKMMTILFFLTAGLGLILSNTASAVLVAPIAIYAAESTGVSPYPYAVAVLIAASAAYSTPVSTPVVTLVVEPGNYSFATFLKLGVPLLLLTCGATMVVAPLVFPF